VPHFPQHTTTAGSSAHAPACQKLASSKNHAAPRHFPSVLGVQRQATVGVCGATYGCTLLMHPGSAAAPGPCLVACRQHTTQRCRSHYSKAMRTQCRCTVATALQGMNIRPAATHILARPLRRTNHHAAYDWRAVTTHHHKEPAALAQAACLAHSCTLLTLLVPSRTLPKLPPRTLLTLPPYPRRASMHAVPATASSGHSGGGVCAARTPASTTSLSTSCAWPRCRGGLHRRRMTTLWLTCTRCTAIEAFSPSRHSACAL
jgi:hypothetical protein